MNDLIFTRVANTTSEPQPTKDLPTGLKPVKSSDCWSWLKATCAGGAIVFVLAAPYLVESCERATYPMLNRCADLNKTSKAIATAFGSTATNSPTPSMSPLYVMTASGSSDVGSTSLHKLIIG